MHQPAEKNNLDDRTLEVTRAYEQGLKDARAKSQVPEGASQETKGGLLSDLSVPQVAAGALAAVTSMLLTNQIGIAGSVIGVAVGSVVSTVASSVYKRMVATGASTIKEKITTSDESPDTTRPLDAQAGSLDASGARIAPEELRQKAHAQQAARTHKKVAVGVIVVAVVAALIGVALSAGFVSLATAGQGLGTKTSLVAPKEPEKSDETSASSPTDQDTASSQPAGTSDDSANKTSDNNAANNDASDSANQNNAANNSSDANNSANGSTTNESATTPSSPGDSSTTPPSDSSANGGQGSSTSGTQESGQGTQGTQGQPSSQSSNN